MFGDCIRLEDNTCTYLNTLLYRAKDTKNLQTKLQHIHKATSSTHTLRKGMLCLSQCSSELNEAILLNILTPQQTFAFLEWMKKNKDKCRAAMQRQCQSVENVEIGHGLDFAYTVLESTKRLNE